ncbi:MAG: monothiol glutaredoxin [Myxococcota bacterium]|jgi:monothiol glutaredoxin
MAYQEVTLGIISKIKKRLPIIGRSASKGAPPRPPARPAPTADFSSDWEEPKSPRGDQSVTEYLGELVGENKIVLFMKGSPASPKCGFSANAAGILASYSKPFAHFDVFLDPEVRQGIKDFSEWPTLPQVYIGGEFIGGSDILMQMHANGELREEIEKAFADAS